MCRKGLRYYKSKQGWYATLGGETFLLIKGAKKETEQRAKELYEAEVAARKVEVDGGRNTVWAVINAYLLDLGNRVETGDASRPSPDEQIHLWRRSTRRAARRRSASSYRST